METALIFSEIVFNLVTSLVIVVVGSLLAVTAYHLVSAARELKGLFGNFNNASEEAGERISEAMNRLSELPVFSYFLRKRPPKQHIKSKSKIINKNNKK